MSQSNDFNNASADLNVCFTCNEIVGTENAVFFLILIIKLIILMEQITAMLRSFPQIEQCESNFKL